MEFALIVWAIDTLPVLGGSILYVGGTSTVFLLFIKGVSLTKGVDVPLLRWFFLSIPMLCLGAVIPDKETAYTMAAVYGVQSVVQDECVQKVAGQGIDVLEEYLEKTKKELEKENK